MKLNKGDIMKIRTVTKAIPYDLLDYYLAFTPELNILFDQYNFPNTFYTEDFMISIYHSELESDKIMKNIYMPSFSNITEISSDEFRIDFLKHLSKYFNKQITGYRITGDTLTTNGKSIIYRIDVYSNEAFDTPDLYTGVFGPNVYDLDRDINMTFNNIKIGTKKNSY